jgi:hypothetical protein
MSGGGGQTTVSSNAPPQQYLDAYSQVLARANQDASTPYQQYSGQLQAGFSPLQQQGFDTTSAANGISAPYINTAATDFTNATNSLTPSFQPQSDQANQQYTQAASANLQGALSPYQTQAAQGFAGGSQAIDPTQYSGAAIQGFQSPYTQQVVDATQAQFNTQNAQAQTALSGNAASKGALGGDRLGVAQAQLAGQQQMAQAPVIAGLNNTGFQNAQQEFNTQQATNLSAQQNTAARQLQGASGIAGLGAQSMTAAQQQAAIQQQAGAGFAGLGQMGLSAAQSQGWLNSQAGSGMAGLGNQALSNTLAEGSADLSAGSQQQQQAQQALNIPYQQYLAQLAYPYQQTGWLSNIAQGLGSGAGGTGSTTAPGPSTASQVAGFGTAAVGAAGIANQAGLFSGLGSNASSFTNGIYNGTGAIADAGAAQAAAGLSTVYRSGGGVRGFDAGGSVPDLTINGVVPGATDVTGGGGGVPDAGASIIPSGGMAGGTSDMKKNYGTTTNTPGSGDSTIGSILKTAGAIAATYWGGPAGGMAANALGSQVHFNRGGGTKGFDGGGAVGDAPASPDPTGFGTLNLGLSPIPSAPTAARHGNTIPKPPTGAKLEDPLAEGQAFAKAMSGFGKPPASNSQSSNRGGSVPILPQGFAAGGSAPISVSMVPDAQGRGVPTMMVNTPAAAGSGSSGSGSASDQLTAYLAQNAAGASHAAPQFGPGAPATPTPSVVDQGFFNGLPATPTSNDAGGGGKRGGLVNGFARGGFPDGGAVGTDAPAPDFDPTMFSPDRFIPPPANDGAPPPPPSAATDTDDDMPTPPLPPGGSAPSHAPVHRGFAHAPPPTDDDGPLPSPSAPPDRPANARPSPTTTPSNHDWIDSLMQTRAAKEDHANPWLSVMQAGFGMMAGTSPHALTNIGAGAMEGMKQYVSADQAAKALAAKVDETRAQLVTAQAYHEATVNSRNYGIDTRHQDAQDRINNALQMATIKAMNQVGRGLTGAEEERSNITALTAPVEKGGLGMSLPDAIEAAKGYAGRGSRQQQSVDQRGDAQAALNNYRAAQISGRLMTADETAKWHDYLKTKGATDEDIKFYGLNKDIMGKPQLTPAAAHAAGNKLRQANGADGESDPGGTLPPAATDAPADPLGIR